MLVFWSRFCIAFLYIGQARLCDARLSSDVELKELELFIPKNTKLTV